MPETSAQDPAIALPAALQNGDATEEDSGTVAFLPPLVSRILIVGWILLFAGRWIVVQGLDAAGLLLPQRMTATGLLLPSQAERLDDAVLGPCYLLLLSITLVTFVLRMVRGLHSEKDLIGSKTGFKAQAGPEPIAEGTVEVDSSDRGGKQA